MDGRGCMGCGGAPPPGYVPDPGVRTWVFDLGNSCQCYGCRQKTSTALNKLQGVIEHCYNLEKNQVIVTGTVDPDVVFRKLSKLKKHVRVMMEPGFMNQPPQPPGDPPQQPPPPPENHNAPPPWMNNHHPVYVHSDDEPPPTTACHCPPPQCTHEPPPHHPAHIRPLCPECHHPHPPPPHHNCSRARLPAPCSAGQGPPPPHNHHHQAPNGPAAMVDGFIHGTSSSPLIPRNASIAGVLDQLANMKRLKHVDLIRQKGIKLTFEDGHVTSYHPTSCMELRPAYAGAALPPPQRYVSPFSEDYPTGPSCTIV